VANEAEDSLANENIFFMENGKKEKSMQSFMTKIMAISNRKAERR